MHIIRRIFVAMSLMLMASALFGAQAQTTTNTIVYKLDGQQVDRGVADAAAQTSYVSYAGSVGGPGSKGFKLKSFNLTVVYDATGFVVGGQWSLLAFREGIATTLNGPIAAGTLLQLNADSSVASGTYLINWAVGDATWPVSGVFTMTVDNKSRPPKISGPLALTFPVVQ